MAYSEEQRPEAQLGNQNRNSLNIQQPGETDSYEAFSLIRIAGRITVRRSFGRCIANNG